MTINTSPQKPENTAKKTNRRRAKIAAVTTLVLTIIGYVANVTGLLSFATGNNLPQIIRIGEHSSSPTTTGGHRTHPSQSPSPHTSTPKALGEQPKNPKPAPVAPAHSADYAAETLSVSITPEDIAITGQDFEVQATITGATPGGQVTWEEDARGTAAYPGSYPGQIPCIISGQGGWCGVDIVHGTATASSNGTAVFDLNFVPGQVYDKLDAQSAADFENVIWEVTAWDNSTYPPGSSESSNRTASAGITVQYAASVSPPADWSRS